MPSQVAENRKRPFYRLLEGSLALASFGFLFLILLLSFFNPTLASVFLIVYSFLWVLKFGLNTQYLIYTYKQLRRWERLDWPYLFELFRRDKDTGGREATKYLRKQAQKYGAKLDWQTKINLDLEAIERNRGTKFADPGQVRHVAIFSIYNEPAEVLLRSIKCIYESGYDLSKLLVVVSQEARNGQEKNQQMWQSLQSQDWIDSHYFVEKNLDLVYSPDHLNLVYQNSDLAKIKFAEGKLGLIYTEHPDGLIGEIKGKASNEDWGGRHASLFLKAQGVDEEMVTVTSLDADSHVGQYFFHHLAYRYCLTKDKLRTGFQPIHVYSNNFFRTGFWQRQVAVQNTLWNMSMLGLEGETHWFAIYSASLRTLQTVDFWVRDLIAEDYLAYAKCLIHFQGQFTVAPFYGVFEGDAVESDDYIEALTNQYRQLQRWAWGGVESFPFLFYHFFLTPAGHQIDIRLRLKYSFLLFTNHFYWASTPILFSVGLLFPQWVGGERFQQLQISQNLSIFSQYFVWISFIFMIIFGYISYRYIAPKAARGSRLSLTQNLLILTQWLISPFVYGFMGIPAMDAQIRGLRGKYLGYWVTPKK